MSITDFCARPAAAMPDATAPDGSEVRLLCATARGSMALFTLAPGMVSRAVAHRSVEEIWYIARGSGRMWRRDATREEIVEIGPDLSGLRRGDLVCWGGHIGIMLDDRQLLHANGYAMATAVEPLRVAEERIRTKSYGPITGIRRLPRLSAA